MLLVPDTPQFLLKKGRVEDARKSLARLRGKDYSGLDRELLNLQETSKASTMDQSASKQEGVGLRTLFSSGVYLKPFGIAVALMGMQQFGGANTVTLYTQQTFIQDSSWHFVWSTQITQFPRPFLILTLLTF